MLIDVTQEIIDIAGRDTRSCMVYHAIRAHFPERDQKTNEYVRKISVGFSTVLLDNKFYTLPDDVSDKIHDHCSRKKVYPFSFEMEI